MNLVDLIELHIKSLLEDTDGNKIILRRNELAHYFGCAPSQINYVIQTRFNIERGYVTESQRGGGGYIRVIRLDLGKVEKLLPTLSRLDGGGASQRQSLDFIHWLASQQLISNREAGIMSSVMDKTVLGLELPLRDGLRARMLVAMVEAILGCGEE